MALAPGVKLGSYELQSQIGAGGMGEVYRARDMRLGRSVAIKILSSTLYSDPVLQKRLEREGRTLSNLSHPHICQLYDIGQENGVHFLVMEYLEGETLASRLMRGPLPADQLLQYGMQIADALESAHRRGIIHRDLKPGNIMLTKNGAKLLDFGLARTETHATPLTETLTGLATEDRKLTEKGAILGTFQYMAPEQLEGKDVDGRTDIFALGAVLYEMATAKAAFAGKTRASLIAAILASEPALITSLQPLTPPMLERVVKTCLAKDPDMRWQSAQDVKFQLQWILEGGSQVGVPALMARRRKKWERLVSAIAVVTLAFVVTVLIRYLRPIPEPQRTMILTVEPPSRYKLDGVAFALSPNGTQVVYAALDATGKRSLWLRSLDTLSSTRLEGSESDAPHYGLVWTPDGNGILARINGKLVQLSAIGGANEVVCDKFDAFPTAINHSGTILMATAPPTQIVSISPDDCSPHLRSPSSTSDSVVGYGHPAYLPDGKHFLFTEVRRDKHHNVLIGSLDDSTPRLLLRNGSHPKYIASGYILFSRDGYLMAQQFDANSQRSSGEPFLAYRNQLDFAAAFGWAAFDVSMNGLISAREQFVAAKALRWYSRSGQVLQTVGEPEFRELARLTAQGTRALLLFFDPRTHAGDKWLVDLEHNTKVRQTFHDRPGGPWAACTPDGTEIVYSALVGARAEMYVKEASSSGNGTMLQTGLNGFKMIGDVSPDGKSIVYEFENDTETEISLYGQSLADGKPFFIARGVDEELPRLSPDGRWVAFPSNELGAVDIFVRPFAPGTVASIQVSFGGGHDPRWSGDARTLFYRTGDWWVIAVPVVDPKQPRFGKPVKLFRLPEDSEYDVVDGKRFLVNEPADRSSPPLFVIANWKPEPPKSGD